MLLLLWPFLLLPVHLDSLEDRGQRSDMLPWLWFSQQVDVTVVMRVGCQGESHWEILCGTMFGLEVGCLKGCGP